MTEPTMLERLIAVCAASYGGETGAESAVRAILTEMREPSDGILAPVKAFYAPHFEAHPEFVDGWVTSAVENMRLMIDAILEGKA